MTPQEPRRYCDCGCGAYRPAAPVARPLDYAATPHGFAPTAWSAPAAPVAQEPPACTCVCIAPGQSGGYNGPLPSEWEQADDCPVHPLTSAPSMDELFSKAWESSDGDDLASRAARQSLRAMAQQTGQQIPSEGSAQEPPAPTCPCGRPVVSWFGSTRYANGRIEDRLVHVDGYCLVVNGELLEHTIEQGHRPPAPGSAQEPADPPWLTAAQAAAYASMRHDPGAWNDALPRAVLAALPILRAGIEQEIWQDVIDKRVDTLAWDMARKAADLDLDSQTDDDLDTAADESWTEFIGKAVAVVELLRGES